MHNVTTSRHIRSATELFIMVPIKNDFVPITELVLTYAGRVSSVLKLLGDLRQQKVERGFGDPNGPIEQLNTIFRVQWSVLEPFDDVKSPEGLRTPQLRQPQILLTSHFDSSWETYFHALVEIGGPLLDLIFSHCEGYEGHSCKHGFEKFSEFVRRHQRPVNFLYATAPEVTIDDVRYFNRLQKQLLDDPANLRKLTVPTIAAESLAQRASPPIAYDELTRAAHRTIQALLDVRKRLFTHDERDGGLVVPGKKRLTDRMLFDNAVRSILAQEPDFFRLGSVLAHRYPHPKPGEPPGPFPDELVEAAAWVRELVLRPPQEGAEDRHARSAPTDAEPQRLPTARELFRDVQGNILSGYQGIDQGRLLMFQCSHADALRALLLEAHDAVTTEAQSQSVASPKPRCNVAISYSGVKLLELPARALELFPREFREGMEERAGILGDVGPNHPSVWRLPRHDKTGARLHLSTIHAVVIVLGSKGRAFEVALDRWQSKEGRELIHTIDLTSTSQPERSQPVPQERYRPKKNAPGRRPAKRDEVSLNQFLLGYAEVDDVTPVDEQGRPLPRIYPTVKESAFGKLFINGSFLAMRKMKQDEAALEAYIADVASLIAAAARDAKKAGAPTPRLDRKLLLEDARALVIGRRKDGTLLGDIQPELVIRKDGTALPPSNDFDFAGDSAGDLCPFQSHVRRTNPRTRGTPRIVRRGLAYVPQLEGPEREESGLVFMAYCANLARQYEVVQRWVNGGNSTGIPSRQNDMLCAAQVTNDIQRVVSLRGTSVAALVDEAATIALPPRDVDKPFVSLTWGLYLFVPSKQGILQLADSAQWLEDERKASVARGEMRLRELEALPTPERRAFEWKRILEEVPEAGSAQARHAEDVAAAITEHRGGVLVVPKIVDDEPYEVYSTPKQTKRAAAAAAAAAAAKPVKHDLVIVTNERLAHAVLSDDTRFSVRHYRARMNQAIQDHYLGYDLDTRDDKTKLSYAQLATEPNTVFTTLESKAYVQAHKLATDILNEPGTIELDPDHRSPDGTLRSTISVRDLACVVIAHLCHDWLDMPGVGGNQPRQLMDSLERFLVASRYCFQVMPAPHLKRTARHNHGSIVKDYGELDFPRDKAARSNSVTPPLVKRFDRKTLGIRRGGGISVEDFCRMAVLGAVGFAPPAVGALLRILDQWIETEELWQVQAVVAPLTTERELLDALLPRIYTAWSQTPAPPTLYRTARKAVPNFGGSKKKRGVAGSAGSNAVEGVDIEDGARIVVNLSAVYADAVRNGNPDAAAWLFRGVHGGATPEPSQTRHGCPGRIAGLNALAGIITALLKRKSLRRERRFLLSYENPPQPKPTLPEPELAAPKTAQPKKTLPSL